MAVWEYILAGANGGDDITDLPNISKRKLTVRLNDSGSATFDVNGLSSAAKMVAELATDLRCVRNGTALFRGRIGPSSDTIDSVSHQVSLAAWDYREVLNRRAILPPDTLVYSAKDQAWIARNLIALAQREDLHVNGDMGIGSDGVDHGVVRDMVFAYGQKVGEQINALANLDNGFEWEIDPNLTFRSYYPMRGDQSGQKVLELGGAVTKITRNVDPSDYANVVRLNGGVPVLPIPKITSFAEQSTGGYFSQNDIYRYQVTAIMPEGESPATPIKTLTQTKAGSTGAIRLNWATVPRATGYNVYGRNPNTGPSHLSAQTLNTGGTLDYNIPYRYGVAALRPDGETAISAVNVTMNQAGGDNAIKLTWWPMYAVTKYYVYGRSQNGTLRRIATLNPLNGNAGDQTWTDTGANDPVDIEPSDGFAPQLLAPNVQATTWLDTGTDAPDYGKVAPTAQPTLPLSAYVEADFVDGAPEGRIEWVEENQDLVLQPTVNARAMWLLNRHANLKPSYTVVLDPNHWRGPEDLWLGDLASLSVLSGRLDVEDKMLRVTEISFDLDEDGKETITAVLGYRPRNIFEKVASVQARLDRVERL